MKIDRHIALLWELWASFLIVRKHVEKLGARVLMKLLRGCGYWRDNRVSNILSNYSFLTTDLDDCQYNLVAYHGKDQGHPIKKP